MSGSEPLAIESGPHRLVGRLHVPATPPRGAFLVTHPHPGHGGHMDHPVVVTTAERAVEAGCLALRFDFRGVRGSEGDVRDDEGHLEDVRRAAALLVERLPARPLLGAGFSYGARLLAWSVGPGTPAPVPFRGLLLLAPATKVPRSPRDFGNLLLGRPLDEAATDANAIASLSRIPLPTRVIVGSNDVVAPEDELAAALSPRARLEVLEGLNHFFSRGRGASATDLETLVPALDDAIERLLASS